MFDCGAHAARVLVSAASPKGFQISRTNRHRGWNALSSTRWQRNAALARDICAYRESLVIVFRRSRSTAANRRASIVLRKGKLRARTRLACSIPVACAVLSAVLFEGAGIRWGTADSTTESRTDAYDFARAKKAAGILCQLFRFDCPITTES